MKLLSFVRQRLKDYAEYSTIDGFSQFVRAGHWVESIFWLLAFIAGVYLTVRDSAPPIFGYMNEATLSKIDFVRNETVSFPGSSICVTLDTSQLPIQNGSLLENREKLAAFAKCVHERSCFKNASFFEDFGEYIGATAKLLALYSAHENGRDSQIEAKRRSVEKLSTSPYRQLANSINSHDLLKAISYALCKQMHIEVKFIRKERSHGYDLCSTALLVWFGIPPKSVNPVDVLCYNIEQFMKFKSMEEKYEISFIALANSTASHGYLSLDGVPIATDLTSDFAIVPYGQCTRVELELLQRITLLSKVSRPCTDRESFIDCYGRCRVAEVLARCNCSAVSWQLYLVDDVTNSSCFSLHSPVDYQSCASATRISKTRKACDHHCLQPCTANIFNVFHWLCPHEAAPNVTSVIYSLHRFFYSHIEEELAFDVSAMVSSLGGIAGLWLGAGFFGLFEAAIFLPKALVEFLICFAKGNAGKSERVGFSEEVLARFSKIELELADLRGKCDSRRRSTMTDTDDIEGTEADSYGVLAQISLPSTSNILDTAIVR